MATLAVFWRQANAWTGVQRLRFARLRSKPFLRNVGILSGGNALGHVFTLAAAPALTRICGPADFGVLGLFTSYLSIAGVAVSLQYELSIVSGRDEAESEYLTLAALLFTLPVSIVAGVVLWGLMRFRILGFSGLPWGAPLLLTPAMCCMGVFTALRYWCLREERFGQVSRGVATQSAGRAILQVAFGAGGLHALGLLLGETAGRCLGMSRMMRSAWPALRKRVAAFRVEGFKRALGRNRKFPLLSLPSSLLDSLCMGLPVPMLIYLYGAAVGGHFSLVWRAITLPSVLLTAAVADAFHSRIAACARQAPERVCALFFRTTAGLLAVGLVPAAVLWFWGVPLFRLAFGAQWTLAGSIASIVATWYLAQFVVSPVSRVVAVFSGQKTKLIWDVLCVVSLAAVFCLARSKALPPLRTVQLLTLVNTGLYLVYFPLLLRVILRVKESASVSACCA
jgi:O-antigen/teichoic acid export membrane protein